MTSKSARACKAVSAALVLIVTIVLVIGYFRSLILKEVLLSKISGRATALIGQRVMVEDLGFSLPGSITIYGIAIINPEGFQQGDLLKIKRVNLTLDIAEIFRQRFHFRQIEIIEPELSLLTDKHNKLNISDAFIAFLSRKGTARYRIDELLIVGGDAAFNNVPLYRANGITASLKNLSSDSGTKTEIEAGLEALGNNRISISGWAYLKNEGKDFALSMAGKDLKLSAFSGTLHRYRIDTESLKADTDISIEGDLDNGLSIAFAGRLKKPGPLLFRKDPQVEIRADAFFSISGDSLSVRRWTLKAGDISSAQGAFVVRSLRKSPSFTAAAKIDRIDLSAFNVFRDIRTNGVITSDAVTAQGNLDGSMPSLSGTVRIRDGGAKADLFDFSNINAVISFSPGSTLSAKAEVSADMLRAGKYAFSRPAGVRLSSDISGGPESTALMARVSLMPVDLDLKGKQAYAEALDASFTGSVIRGALQGNITTELANGRYDDHLVRKFTSALEIAYRSSAILIKDLKASTESVSITAGAVKVSVPPKKSSVSVTARDISAVYPAGKVRIDGTSVSADMETGSGIPSGEIAFSVAKLIFQDAESGGISGTARFGGKDFSLEIPDSSLFKGSVRLSAKGKTTDGPYPVHLDFSGRGLALSPVSNAMAGFFSLPYSASGDLQSVAFKGTVSSPGLIEGSASLSAKNISLTTAEGRNFIKDTALSSNVALRGKDLDFRAQAASGSTAVSLSGSAKGFAGKDISVTARLSLPRSAVKDIRDSFWDVFPDKFLYAGLDGSVAADIALDYGKGKIRATGQVALENVLIEGENREYYAGPVNGIIPVRYDSAGNGSGFPSMPSFDRAEFETLKRHYADEPAHDNENLITIGSLRYGFRLLEDITVWIGRKGSLLNISRFNATMFGGRVRGSAYVDLSGGLQYRTGVIMDGVSLTKLCNDIEPIKGYISGKIDGIAFLRGTGTDLKRLIGKADFWTYSDKEEKTRISRAFLEKIGGPQVRAYLGERRFDKGIMSAYVQNGFIIFRELEISNRNIFGVTDLLVRVAPLNNRIALDHLMWTVVEAAERAKKQ